MTESATLYFPPIVETAQSSSEIAVAPKSAVTIKEAAVAHLRSHEPTILALAERYRDVALPLDTPKGLAAGQAALTEVRENGRFAVQRVRDATKDLLNGAKKDVEAEATRLIALIQPTEVHIEAQITARKAVLAAEKAEKERIEAERVAKHQAGISIIRSYINQAQGKTSEQIARVLPTVEAIDCSAERFEEFSGESCKAIGEVSLALHWVIVGGESGPKARPMHPDWVRSLRDQCAAAGVPFLFKQWGEWCPRGPESFGYPSVDGVPRVRLTDAGQNGQNLASRGGNDVWMNRAGKKAAGRHLDGVTHDGFPGGANATQGCAA